MNDKKIFADIRIKMLKEIENYEVDDFKKALFAYLFNAEDILRKVFPKEIEDLKKQGLIRENLGDKIK